MSAYTDAVARGLEGLRAVSTGVCPGCPECMEEAGYTDKEEHHRAWETCRLSDEGSFSWEDCDICRSPLGGTKYLWHGIDADGEIRHFIHACTDCVMYLANGAEPESWGDE